MKKFLVFCFCICFFSSPFFAENNTVSAANKKTAQRCLSLAENYLFNNAFSKAYSQAELGLSYDDSISDLYFIKATAQNHLGYKKAEVLKTVESGINKNNWTNNNQNNARILYADLLSDTLEVQKSLDVLNKAPIISSPDAEFIRIKDYYRLGTKQSISEARTKLDTARRVYPKDERFAQIFFMFETLFLTDSLAKGFEYKIPSNVQKIADDYILKFPDYKNPKNDLEVMASYFTSGDTQSRLLKATAQKEENGLYALAALKAGIISEEKAYNLFFEKLGNDFDLFVLLSFIPLIKDEAIKQEIKKYMNAYQGVLYIDENLDLIYELKVTYERGRPVKIEYDKNNDELLELNATCDFGVPKNIIFENENVTLEYNTYPNVQLINEPCKDENLLNKFITYNFLGTDYKYSPFEMLVNNQFTSLGVSLYIPYINEEYSLPDKNNMLLNTSSVKVPILERENAYATYVLLTGKPYSIEFTDSNNKRYAYTNCNQGFPFVRYVDYDNDLIFETSEIFNLDTKGEFTSTEDIKLINSIFGTNFFNQSFYLSQIKIDRNNDGLAEFSEEYLPKNGKISSWDNDANGVWDYEFIRYSKEEGKPLKEETIFYDDAGFELVSVTDLDKKPSLVTVKKVEQQVFQGETKNLYFISQKESKEIEKALYNKVKEKLNIGEVVLVDLKSEGRFNIIKVGKNIFIKKLSPSDLQLNIMKETTDEKY